MQFRTMGRKIQCIRTLRRGKQVIVTTFPRDSTQPPPATDLPALTEDEHAQLVAWLAAREDRARTEKADAIVLGAAKAIREVADAIKDVSPALAGRRDGRDVNLHATIVRNIIAATMRLMKETRKAGGWNT